MINKLQECEIVSSRIMYKNNSDMNILGYIDSGVTGYDAKPFIIIPPGYGETKKDHISTAYYLVSNGFNVLRYDNTNHIGESDGEMVDCNLLSMEKDLDASINFITSNFATDKVGVIASSLASRVAFKVASRNSFISFIISLVGVTNLRKSIYYVYKEKMIEGYIRGRRWGITDILGFEVSDNFLKIAVENNYDTFISTLNDIKRIEIPILYIVAEHDAWTDIKDSYLVYKKTKNINKELFFVSNALHQIQENPKLAKQVILKIVKNCIKYMHNCAISDEQCMEPDIHFIVRQNRIEQTNLKKTLTVTRNDEKKFWTKYMSDYFILMKSYEYKNFLRLNYELLGGFIDGNNFLDAGCGNGHFGAWLATKLCQIEKISRLHNYNKILYTGIDFVDPPLKEALDKHAKLIATLSKKENIDLLKKMKFVYIVATLENELPLENNFFDKICCNLVISYVKKPVKVIQNLVKKMKEGGKITVSSLKPNNDLSLIYRKALDQSLTSKEVFEARRLLTNAGKIKYKEKIGHYTFFNEFELLEVLRKAGCKEIHTFRTFGDQANIAVGTK